VALAAAPSPCVLEGVARGSGSNTAAEALEALLQFAPDSNVAASSVNRAWKSLAGCNVLTNCFK
jgi:hypothetical protein